MFNTTHFHRCKPATVATCTNTGLNVKVTDRLTDDASTTIVNLANENNPADAHLINYANIDDAMNNFNSTLDFPQTTKIANKDLHLVTAVSVDPVQTKVATTTLADNEPLHQTDDSLKKRQFITATTMAIYRLQQPVSGELATIATRANTSLIVTVTI